MNPFLIALIFVFCSTDTPKEYLKVENPRACDEKIIYFNKTERESTKLILHPDNTFWFESLFIDSRIFSKGRWYLAKDSILMLNSEFRRNEYLESSFQIISNKNVNNDNFFRLKVLLKHSKFEGLKSNNDWQLLIYSESGFQELNSNEEGAVSLGIVENIDSIFVETFGYRLALNQYEPNMNTEIILDVDNYLSLTRQYLDYRVFIENRWLILNESEIISESGERLILKR